MIFPVQWKGRNGEILTYDRDYSTYKSGKKASDEENKKSATHKEDIER